MNEGPVGAAGGGWTSPNVWASARSFGANPVTQLLVPASTFQRVGSGVDGELRVDNNFGEWPAFAAGTTPDPAVLMLRTPLGTSAGDALRRNCSWAGPTTHLSPPDVVATYRGALTFVEGGGNGDARSGLRTPQLGAVHAVLGYWTTGDVAPATVVMPTGTGKTETMLALLVAGAPERLMVLVPTDALRDQIVAKFERLGLLQELGIVSPTAIRPNVGRLLHGFTDLALAQEFTEACNVILATPAALQACTDDSRSALISGCSHLFVDEAHHVAARTWSDIRDKFAGKPVVQFTATPFREDGAHLGGRVLYAFPLRKAQEQGYFSVINYKGVLDPADADRAVATQAVDQLKADQAAGYQHLLMARVRSIGRAHELLPLYQELAPEMNPVVLNSGQSRKAQTASLGALRDGSASIVICVDMLGEGFDLPSLKVAAVHDPKKSLGVTLQFIGRFARTSATTNLGAASVFVARTEITVDKRLRKLYSEDPDWNLVLRDLTESAVQEARDASEFDDGFDVLPDNISIRSLLPKLSTVVYRTPVDVWDPHTLIDLFGEENFLTQPPIAINEALGVAWCVLEHRQNVRWGDVETVEELSYELFVVYFDRDRRLLYINSSTNSGVFQEIADVLVGEGAVRYTGATVYRVMGDIMRLIPTTVGVLDAHNQFRRFSMHVGQDVGESFTPSEAGTKSQTNISGGGYRDGEHVNISASRKGRIWTPAAATHLRQFCSWCDGLGDKLLDETINLDSILKNFIIPAPLDARPASVLLGLEWPWQTRLVGADHLRLSHDSKVYALLDVDLRPTDQLNAGPFNFTIETDAWSVRYCAELSNQRLVYRCLEPQEVEVLVGRGTAVPLSSWLANDGLTFLLEHDELIDGDLLYKASFQGDPFDRDQLTRLDWTGVNLKVESRGAARRADSVQVRAIREVQGDPDAWDIILDDDGKGEVADIVAMRVDGEGLLVRLVHCKYSSEDTPGGRLLDLYEVCGQAQKSIVWRRRDMEPFFAYLERRARRKQQREGQSPFVVGDMAALYRLKDQALVRRRRMEIVIAQPGLSAAAAQPSHLELLAATESYLRSTIAAPLAVWCSA
jgi:superfamily II DNA or RNA helicase